MRGKPKRGKCTKCGHTRLVRIVSFEVNKAALAQGDPSAVDVRRLCAACESRARQRYEQRSASAPSGPGGTGVRIRRRRREEPKKQPKAPVLYEAGTVVFVSNQMSHLYGRLGDVLESGFHDILIVEFEDGPHPVGYNEVVKIC